jgi:hypothetical protein
VDGQLGVVCLLFQLCHSGFERGCGIFDLLLETGCAVAELVIAYLLQRAVNGGYLVDNRLILFAIGCRLVS